MNSTLRWSMLLTMALLLTGCYYYPQPVVVAGATPMERFDRSWDAAAGAMADQGLAITSQDRGAGRISGTRGAVTITATVSTLPDGSIQVRFDTPGGSNADPGLIHRVSDSYDRRMGR